MNLKTFIMGFLALFLLAGLTTSKCICDTEYPGLTVTISDLVVPCGGFGTPADPTRTSPLGVQPLAPGDNLTIELDMSYVLAAAVLVDGILIGDGNYAWGHYTASEGAHIQFTNLALSHTVDITYQEDCP